MATYKQVTIPIFPQFPYPPASSYQLFSYAAGTTTKQATFTDSTGITQNANPATIQAGSSAPTYLTVFCQVGLSYKFVLAPSTDTDPPQSPLWTVDNIQIDDNLDLTPYISIGGGVMTLTNTTLTSPTITNPKISTKINDSNGNAIITFNPTASAVNDVQITNATTGNYPIVQTTGTDSNQTLAFRGVGNLGVRIGTPSGSIPLILEPGSTTNTQSHTMTLTGARTVTWPDADTNLKQYAFSVYKAAAQNITTGAENKIQFDTKEFDIQSVYDNSTNYRFTAPVASYYLLTAAVGMSQASSANVLYQLGLKKNGTTYVATATCQKVTNGIPTNLNAGAEPLFVLTRLVSLAANDYIEVYLWHNDAGAENSSFGAAGCWFNGYKLSSLS